MRKIICPININTKAKAKKYFRGINFTSFSMSTVRVFFFFAPIYFSNFSLLRFMCFFFAPYSRQDSSLSWGATNNYRIPKHIAWGAANGGLRDGGLSKSEDIWGKRPFSSVFWISQVFFEKGRKRAKKAGKGRKRPMSADFQEGRPDTP